MSTKVAPGGSNEFPSPTLARPGEANRLPLPANLSRVGLHHARHDLHQRPTCRAVFSGERMDLAGQQLEVDARQYLDAWIRFDDSAELDEWRRQGVASSAALSMRPVSIALHRWHGPSLQVVDDRGDGGLADLRRVLHRIDEHRAGTDGAARFRIRIEADHVHVLLRSRREHRHRAERTAHR